MNNPSLRPRQAQPAVSAPAEEWKTDLPYGFTAVRELPLGQIVEDLARPHLDERDPVSARETVLLAATVWNISRTEPDTHVEALGQLVLGLVSAGAAVEEAADFVFDLYDRACAYPGDDRRVERTDVTIAEDAGLAVWVVAST